MFGVKQFGIEQFESELFGDEQCQKEYGESKWMGKRKDRG